MNIVEVYGVDNGYFNTKVKGERSLLFRSRVSETEDDRVTGGMVLEYRGCQYRIGEGTDDIEIRKTDGLVHKLCTLAALAQVSEDTEEFKIVVGLPLSHYKNRNFREEFREYMMKPIIHNIRWNGEPKAIVINDCLVFPQGAAALYADNPAQYKNRLVGIVDMGGLTVNGCIFEDLKPIPESMFTINAGTIILYNSIKSALNESFTLNIQDYEIPYLVNDPPEDYQKIIEDVMEEHFSIIKKEMRRKNWSIETINMLGVGGGILVTKGKAEKYLPNITIARDPLYANAAGLYNVGRMMWR